MEPQKFNEPNHKSRGQRNMHTCEKTSCKYSIEENRNNQAGCAEHMPYDQFLSVASQQKASKDRLDGLCHLRKVKERGTIPIILHRNENWFKNNEDSLQIYTKLHRMRVEEQTKRVQEMNKIGPRNIGTFDAKQAFLSRPINDQNRFCSNPNWNASIEEEFDQFNNIGVLAANADTEDVYFAVE